MYGPMVLVPKLAEDEVSRDVPRVKTSMVALLQMEHRDDLFAALSQHWPNNGPSMLRLPPFGPSHPLANI